MVRKIILLIAFLTLAPVYSHADLISGASKLVHAELVSSGISLDKLNYSLRIEASADGAVVSVLDQHGSVVKIKILEHLPSEPSSQIAHLSVAVAQMLNLPKKIKTTSPKERPTRKFRAAPVASEIIWKPGGKKQFLANKIHFRTPGARDALQGSKQQLYGSRFYEAVGRKDLAAKYDGSSSLRTMGAVGTIGGGLAAIVSIVGYSSEKDALQSAYSLENAAYHAERADNFQTAALIFSGVTVISSVIWIAHSDPHPLNAKERKQLAKKYNQRLLKKATVRKDLSISPVVGPSQAGLSVASRF